MLKEILGSGAALSQKWRNKQIPNNSLIADVEDWPLTGYSFLCNNMKHKKLELICNPLNSGYNVVLNLNTVCLMFSMTPR